MENRLKETELDSTTFHFILKSITKSPIDIERYTYSYDYYYYTKRFKNNFMHEDFPMIRRRSMNRLEIEHFFNSLDEYETDIDSELGDIFVFKTKRFSKKRYKEDIEKYFKKKK